MHSQNLRQTNFLDGYRYLFRNTKGFWDRNGGMICTIAGTTGLFLSGVHACRTTYKHHEELKEYGHRISDARKYVDGEKSYKRYGRIAKEVAICGLKTTKHYLPDIVGAALSGYVNSKGWGIEHNHYEQAATMVGVLASDFMNYRKNVIAEHGKEADRKYMTTKRHDEKRLNIESDDGTKIQTETNGKSDGVVVSLDPNTLRIWYSPETTPTVWSPSHAIRMNQLDQIRNRLDWNLLYGGSYTVNDVRREFYGRKGDVAEGGMFGRIWDPGNPEHPERGRRVNLHYEEDEDFMCGLTDRCWIIIDIDEEPLFSSLSAKKERDKREGRFLGAEVI